LTSWAVTWAPGVTRSPNFTYIPIARAIRSWAHLVEPSECAQLLIRPE
jgi:hypothetical protein